MKQIRKRRPEDEASCLSSDYDIKVQSFQHFLIRIDRKLQAIRIT